MGKGLLRTLLIKLLGRGLLCTLLVFVPLLALAILLPLHPLCCNVHPSPQPVTVPCAHAQCPVGPAAGRCGFATLCGLGSLGEGRVVKSSLLPGTSRLWSTLHSLCVIVVFLLCRIHLLRWARPCRMTRPCLVQRHQVKTTLVCRVTTAWRGCGVTVTRDGTRSHIFMSFSRTN